MNQEIFFLSYAESNALENFAKLKNRFPQAQHIHGIKGIKNAHQHIARLAKSEYFFIVDGDNLVGEEFDFSIPAELNTNTLYVWRARNPVNDLCYGFGGIKLYNRHLLLELHRETGVDVATTIAPIYLPVPIVASITQFNATPLESWRGAFRESVKLTLNTLRHPSDTASRSRLQVWRTQGLEQKNGIFCLRGANMGHNYATLNWQNKDKLALINDFDWLQNVFLDAASETPQSI